MDKKISVLLSVYVKENPEYLKIALESIWDIQELKPSQIVIIKDGELTAELDKILDEFAFRAPVDFIINEVNLGLSASLNKGLLACKNELVARMDTDDIAHPERFKKQVEYFNNNTNVDIVGTYAKKIDIEGKVYGDLRVPIEHDNIYKLIWTNPFIHPSVMFKRSRIILAGNYEIPKDKRARHDDYELWFRCAATGLNFHNIPEFLMYYRLVPNTVMKNNRIVAWHRFTVGVKGCVKLKSSPVSFIGLLFPLFRSILPYPLNFYFNKLMITINPRTK